MLLLLLRSLPSGSAVYTRAPSGGGYARLVIAGTRISSSNTSRTATPNTTRQPR